jgi:hypothetical protein
MASIPELPEPGVEILQEYVAQSPVTVIPTLVPCIVGVCKEIREALQDDGTINPDVLVQGPAIATDTNDEDDYTSINAHTLIIRVKGGVPQTFTMPAAAGNMTAQDIAVAINGSTPAPVDFAAYVFEDDSGDKHLQLRSLASGEDVTIQIVGGTLVTAGKLGFGIGYTYYGLGSYIQDAVYLQQSSFPDPRGNLSEINIDEDTVRVFMDLGTEIREILRSEAFLRKGSSIAIFNDGDGDLLTPYINLAENLLASPTVASITGTVSLATAQYLHNKTLILQANGSGKQTVTFVGNPVVSAAVAGSFPLTTNLTLTVNGTTGIVVAISAAADLAGLVDQINDDADIVALGVGDVAFQSDANGNTGTTHLGLIVGGNPLVPVVNTEIAVTADSGGDLWPTLTGNAGHQTLGSSSAGPRDPVIDQINNVFPTTIASMSGNYLKLATSTVGYEAKIEIDANSTAIGDQPTDPATLLGLNITTNGNKFYGSPFNVHVGDALYGDGLFIGNIIEVHSGAVSGRIRLDREVATTATWSTWYVIAKNLDTVSTSLWGVAYPLPDLYLDTSGDVHIKHDFLRDTTGNPVDTTAVSLYVAYEAVRLDVTSEAENPDLLAFSTFDELESALGPVVPENPLAFGLYVAMGNSGNAQVTGIGVSETSADKPYGTIEGFMKAYDYLKTKEVYGIAQMTSDADVATLLQTHVNAMREKTMKGERIGVFHLGIPTRERDTLIVSGNDGDTRTVGPSKYLDTKIATISQALLANGIDPTSIDVTDGVFLDIGTDAYNWNITGSILDGTKVKINTTFAPGQNDDGFYATGTFPTVLSDSFSVKIRGAAIANSTAGRAKEVETIYYRGQGFSDKAMWMIQCDQLKATVGSVEQLIPGFYGCAAKVGLVSGLNPAAPMTKYPMAVITGVTGTTDRYERSQLNQMAAGGADIYVQDAAGAPVHSRMQVTTSMASVEQREQSIVKAVDYSAKYYRSALKPWIGKYNITKAFLDTLMAVAEGASRWLVEEGKVLAGATPNNLLQSDVDPTMVLLDVSEDVFYPCNTIRVTLLI